jgi:kynurenine formamidase
LEAAQWLVGHGIILLGIDTPSVTPLHDRSRLKAVHQTFLKAGVVIIECLANLRALHDSEVYFIGLPIRIEHGDGSPVRAVAIEGQLEE